METLKFDVCSRKAYIVFWMHCILYATISTNNNISRTTQDKAQSRSLLIFNAFIICLVRGIAYRREHYWLSVKDVYQRNLVWFEGYWIIGSYFVRSILNVYYVCGIEFNIIIIKIHAYILKMKRWWALLIFCWYIIYILLAWSWKYN